MKSNNNIVRSILTVLISYNIFFDLTVLISYNALQHTGK